MVKKTNPSLDDISVFFDAAKGTMSKDHENLKTNILRDSEKTNSELKELLKVYNRPTGGNKQHLVDRVLEIEEYNKMNKI